MYPSPQFAGLLVKLSARYRLERVSSTFLIPLKLCIAWRKGVKTRKLLIKGLVGNKRLYDKYQVRMCKSLLMYGRVKPQLG